MENHIPWPACRRTIPSELIIDSAANGGDHCSHGIAVRHLRVWGADLILGYHSPAQRAEKTFYKTSELDSKSLQRLTICR